MEGRGWEGGEGRGEGGRREGGGGEKVVDLFLYRSATGFPRKPSHL